VSKVERKAGGLFCLYFDELEGTTASIDFSTLKPSPVIIYGQSSLDGWSATTSKYYSTFSVDPRVKLGTQTTLTAADVGAKTRDIFIGLAYNPPNKEGTKDNEVVYANSLLVNPTTFDVTVGAIPNIPASPGVNCFVYVKNHATVAGESWANTISPTSTVGAVHTYTIVQAQHQLNTQNYITRFYTADTGLEIFPDSLVVTGSTITAQFTDNDGAAWDGQLRVVIVSIPEIDVESRTVVAKTTASVNFPIAADFAFFEVYQVNGSTLSRVFPDSIVVNSQTATMTVTNSTDSEVIFRIIWDRATVRTNKLCVTDVGAIGEDVTPQLVLYGLNHEELYPSKPDRAGWVTHIDSYKSEGENYLIAGLGWNLFKAVTNTALPVRQPLLRISSGDAVRTGPLFASASTPTNRVRDRISYSFTGGNEGWANIESIQYQSSTGWVKVKVSTPNRAKHLNNGGAAIDATHDRLTVQNASQKVHRGEWPVMQFEETDSDSLTFWVYNPNVDSPDYDEDSVGEAGVFTDKVEFVLPSSKTYSLVVGDILESASFEQGISGSLSCVSTIITGGKQYSYFTGIGETIEFPGGQVYTVRRTGRMLRLRDITNPNINPFEGFLAGDVVKLSDRERRYRILYAIPADVTGIAIEFNTDVEGQATITSVNSTPFKVGQWLTLSAAGRFSGEYQIKDIPNTTTMVLDCSDVKDKTTSAPTGTYIQGYVLELNYSDEFYDDPNSLLSVTVPLRWFPLENPTGSPRRVKHFESKPYTNQTFVRSVMAQDNMYFANYDDHLLKYDGVSLYRTGLIRWQPGLFAAPDISASAKIIVPKQVSVPWNVTLNAIHLDANASTVNAFPVGSKINIAGSSINPYTVTSISVDSNNHRVFIDKQIDIPSSNNVAVSQHEPTIYRYYFRLTAYDANDNIVTSATTGSNEFQVVLTESAAIRLRLIGLPKLEQLNYSRIYLEVYRTKRNTPAPFYNIYKKALEFDINKPYIDITDTTSDEALPSQPDDSVLTFLAGQNLGNGLSQPPQAKYCTTADNRLVLGNISDDPKIQVDIYNNPSLTDLKPANLPGDVLFHLRKDGTTNTNDLTFELKGTSTASNITNISASNDELTLTITNGQPIGLTVNSWIYAYNTAAPASPVTAGWYQVKSVVSTPGSPGNTVLKLYAVGITAITARSPNDYDVNQIIWSISYPSSTTFPILIEEDYNYGWRNANSTVLFSFAARVLLRLANAINFSQAVSSSPWVFANAGLDLGGQTMVLTFPENNLKTTPELVFPLQIGGVDYYGNKVKVADTTVSFTSSTSFNVLDPVKVVNGVWSLDTSPYTAPYYKVVEKTGAAAPYSYKAAYAAQVGAVTSKFPSRVVISYPNYAEVFHRPFDENNYLSESIIDVNPADGQEITGVFPFFSDSTFTASQQAASVIVFKTNSIYVIDPASRKSQQIETNGLGCTAPYSIAATREGLMFANEAGIYRLTRNLTIEPIGSYIDRLWREGVNRSQLGLMQGHAYGIGRRYKVSIPKTAEKVPSNVLVYDYTRETAETAFGSWTQYTNHAATGWCNLLEDAYFGSTNGRVYKISNANSKFDYQDDGTAITGFTVFRALDFGDSAIRKRVLHLLVHYRIPNLSEGQIDTNTATVSMGVNLVDNFMPLDTFKLDVPNSPDGLSTLTPNKQVTLRYAVRNPKSLYFQVKIEDTGLHTPLQVTGLSFRVSGLSTEGITEAAQTMKE
jgi:hypothetical protein